MTGARRLVTIRAGQSLEEDLAPGAIVRIEPGSDWTDEQIEHAVTYFRDAGAAAVKVLPRAAGPQVMVKPAKAAPRATLRQVALEVMAEMKGADEARLREAVEETLAEVGL